MKEAFSLGLKEMKHLKPMLTYRTGHRSTS